MISCTRTGYLSQDRWILEGPCDGVMTAVSTGGQHITHTSTPMPTFWPAHDSPPRRILPNLRGDGRQQKQCLTTAGGRRRTSQAWGFATTLLEDPLVLRVHGAWVACLVWLCGQGRGRTQNDRHRRGYLGLPVGTVFLEMRAARLAIVGFWSSGWCESPANHLGRG